MDASQTLNFDPIGRAFVPTTAELSREIIASSDYGVAPYGRGYSELTRRTGHEFPGIDYALNYLPIAHDGERHVFLRELAADFLKRNTGVLRDARLRLVPEAVGAFTRTGSMDLMADVIRPMVEALVFDLTGVRGAENLTAVFNRALSLRKRQALDTLFTTIEGDLRTANPGFGDDEIGMRIAFAILGVDATIGLLSQNIIHVLSAHIGKRLCEMPWPLSPEKTSVLTIERTAKCPMAHDGQTLPTGTDFRVDMELAISTGDSAAMFGLGRHLCLGRGFATALWRDVSVGLSGLASRVVSINVGPTVNRIVAIPQFVIIEVQS